ncbi:hypothetical protein LRF89_10765 [Halorhodospira sp. 9621]|uniref:hypothetical protein n=1 Tax=Halorhodospira TaxID=85108 RepID=UPI001EE78627|nr:MULTISPECIES: hypothetical protein [Halorhodospira]MCG5528687.1 hypothetical protein [Halorhodospira halophila]MCG5533918.1 hypothetical protein [Halorhodospira sp. 9621]MCG5544014.1 hypothetical protein [Halorhodospira sp. 9628]
MLSAFVTILILLGICAAIAQFQPHGSHRAAAREGWRQLQPLLTRLPVALIAAAFLAVLIPAEAVGSLFGEDSGGAGILIASLLGGFLPGGPVVAFPLVVVLSDAGAGMAQLIALITAWSVLAFHRVAAFELPMLGARTTAARLLVSLPLPVLAGVAAGALTGALAT